MPDVVRPVAVATTAVLLLAGCGGVAERNGDATRPASELTPERIASVVADHVDREPSEVSPWDVMERELGVTAPGAYLQFARRYTLGVAVAEPTDSALVCATPDFFDRCVDLEHDGEDLVLAWQELEPEEDPGIVYVIDRRGDEDVVVQYGGVSVTGDPRELDLGISVDALADIAADGRLTLGGAE